MAAKPIRLIVGLGNPGAEYERTRHNAGAWFIEQLLGKLSQTAKPESKFFGRLGKINLGGHTAHVLLPGTYMNESGRSVLAVAQFFKLSPQEILVAHDELDHPTGSAKLKYSGGHGGHNGLRDITQVFSSSDFARLRIGIGHPGDRTKVTPYVLSAPTTADKQAIEHTISLACGVVPELMRGEWNRAVKSLHDQITI